MKHDLTKSNDPSNIRPPSYSLHHLGTSRPATIAIFSLSSFDAQVVSRRLNSYGKFYPGIPLLCLTSLETKLIEGSKFLSHRASNSSRRPLFIQPLLSNSPTFPNLSQCRSMPRATGNGQSILRGSIHTRQIHRKPSSVRRHIITHRASQVHPPAI